MKHKYAYILVILSTWLLTTNKLYSQKEGNAWYFGDYAGITFNGASPIADTSGLLSTFEGTSTICDKSGNLLFYTDGITVWNKNHQVMPSGTGLAGNSSSTQSAVIVPQPGKANIYYIFTTPQLAQTPGATYSIVDMNLNGSLGDVTVKNELLNASSCEKVTAGMQCNGKDYWIVFHEFNSDVFYTYPLTSKGVGNVVTSGVGINVTGSASKTRGEIKISPNGKKIAIANDNLSTQLFDFDNSTGLISNSIGLNITPRGYGVCFSPDNSKLYISTGWTDQDIYQYDLNASNIAASQILVGTTAASYIGSLQNAPDGKIYVATYGAASIGAITNPNAAGTACAYVDSAVGLNGRICKWGLPNFPQNFFDSNNSPLVLSYNLGACNNGIEVSFSSNFSSQPDSIVLTYGDGSFSNDLSLSHTYTINGTYLAALTVYSGCKILYDTASININMPAKINLGNDTLICSGATVTLDATSSGATYLWSTGATTTSIQVNVADTYSVQVNIGTCILNDTLAINVEEINVGFTYQTSCQNDTIVFMDTTSASNLVSWSWNFGDGSTDSVSNPIHVYSTKTSYLVNLSVISSNGCSASFSESIRATANPIVAFKAANVCIGDTTNFTDASIASVGKINGWNWDLGDGNYASIKNPIHVYAAAGNYAVTLSITTDSGCTAFTTQQVSVYDSPIAGFNLSSNMFCENDSLSLVNTSQASSGSSIKDYVWNFGNGYISRLKKPGYAYSGSGNYAITLEVTSDLGCVDQDTQQVQINPLPVANTGVTDACKLDSIPFSDKSFISNGGISTWQWNFGDNNTSTLANPVHSYNTDSTFEVSLIVTSILGCKDTAFAQVNVNERPIVDFGTSLACTNQQVDFTNQTSVVGNNNLSWTWNLGDGNTSSIQNPSPIFASAGKYSVTLIASNKGCLDSLTQTINVYPSPIAAFDYQDTYQCTAQTVEYTDQSSISNSTISNWNWSFGDGASSTQINPSHIFSTQGAHVITLTVISIEGCKAVSEETINTTFNEVKADFDLSKSETSLLESTIDFSDNSTGAQSLVWFLGDGNTKNNETDFSHAYADTGMYTVLLVASNNSGCIDSSMKTVRIKPDNSLYIPNAFTPNGDGKNDNFTVVGLGIDQFLMRIYDRWGDQIFSTDKMQNGWDGTNINGDKSTQGMYVYEVAIKYENGKEQQFKGGVHLIR